MYYNFMIFIIWFYDFVKMQQEHLLDVLPCCSAFFLLISLQLIIALLSSTSLHFLFLPGPLGRSLFAFINYSCWEMKCRESLATCSSDIFHLQPICDKSSSNDPDNEGVGSLSFELQNNKMFPFVGWLVVMTKSRRNFGKMFYNLTTSRLCWRVGVPQH